MYWPAEMGQRTYRLLMGLAITLTVMWVSWSLYDMHRAREPGDYAYHAGSNHFADGRYPQALEAYQQALDENPAHLAALRGKAEALMMLRQETQAIEIYQQLIQQQPEFAGHHANLGIAFDRVGEHYRALLSYRKALSLDTEVGDGPGWLTRFFRKQTEKPPGIAERADYLQAQLSLPAAQRVLRIPEVDADQRPYKE